MFADALCVFAACVLTGWVLTDTGNLPVHWRVVFQAGIVGGILATVCFRAWGHYKTSRLSRIPASPPAILLAAALSVGAVLGISHSNWMSDTRLWVWAASAIAASIVLLLASRLAFRRALSRCIAAGRFDQRIAVFGSGNIATRVRDHLRRSDAGISFAGAYDDRSASEARMYSDRAADGRLDDLIHAAREGHIDQIVIALPPSADQRVAQVARQLEHLPVSLHVVTHIASDLLGRGGGKDLHKVSNIGPVGVLDVKRKALSDWAPLVKQGEDYLLGALLTLAFLPLMAVIALAIKLDSPGPVLFVQRRRGLNQRIIRVFKFRTMSVLEDGADIKQATANDSRVTRLGRLLRRSSLDELPQLINVLRGEMSLVGPRPHALVHDERFSGMLEDYANRHQVKPGLTGLAQVRGLRGDTSTPDKISARVDADIEYIKTWSLKLDIEILARTFGAVLRPENAH